VIYALAAGLTIGYTLCYLAYREERKWLRAELRVAHAQIAHAVVHEGATVPARLEPAPPPEPLSGALRECVEQWDTAESRAVEEAKIRGWQAEGWGEAAILKQYGVRT
jgi:hypothetical protein